MGGCYSQCGEPKSSSGLLISAWITDIQIMCLLFKQVPLSGGESCQAGLCLVSCVILLHRNEKHGCTVSFTRAPLRGVVSDTPSL